LEEVIHVEGCGGKEYLGVYVPHTRQDVACMEYTISALGMLVGVEVGHRVHIP
jgi:hypothetical protein